MANDKLSIQDVAIELEVSTKTVHRYLEKGILTKIKQGHRIFIPAAEVQELKQKLQRRVPAEAHQTVTIDLDRYNTLLTELGELRREALYHEECRKKLKANEEELREKEKQIAYEILKYGREERKDLERFVGETHIRLLVRLQKEGKVKPCIDRMNHAEAESEG